MAVLKSGGTKSKAPSGSQSVAVMNKETKADWFVELTKDSRNLS